LRLTAPGGSFIESAGTAAPRVRWFCRSRGRFARGRNWRESMAYDRFDTRRDDRQGRPRWREDEQGWDRDRSDRDRGDRGWFERAGDEIASWFGDEDGDGRRGRPDGQRFGSHGDQDRQGWLGGAQSAERGRGSQRDH